MERNKNPLIILNPDKQLPVRYVQKFVLSVNPNPIKEKVFVFVGEQIVVNPVKQQQLNNARKLKLLC